MSDAEERRENDEEQPRIKVTDRRLFDRQGNPREPDPEVRDASAGGTATGTTIGDAADSRPADAADAAGVEPPRSGPAPHADLGARRPAEPAPETAQERADGPPRGAQAGGAAGLPPEPGELPHDFAAFVESQYFEAMLYLGAARHPHSGEVREDLTLAKYKIDILGMLQDKTEGNLGAEERNLLEEALYQLRMLYLQKTRSGAG